MLNQCALAHLPRPEQKNTLSFKWNIYYSVNHASIIPCKVELSIHFYTFSLYLPAPPVSVPQGILRDVRDICAVQKLFKINHENTKVRKHEKDTRKKMNVQHPTSNEKRISNSEKRLKVEGTGRLYQIFSATNDHEFTRIYENYSI